MENQKERAIDRAVKRFDEMPLPGFAQVMLSEKDSLLQEIQTQRMMLQALSMEVKSLYTQVLEVKKVIILVDDRIDDVTSTVASNQTHLQHDIDSCERRLNSLEEYHN